MTDTIKVKLSEERLFTLRRALATEKILCEMTVAPDGLVTLAVEEGQSALALDVVTDVTVGSYE